MTFSDEKVIEFVNKNFVAAWESVAPVSLATFDLGHGKSLKGAYGGNIALYLCDTQGRVLDVLPALQTPTVTLQWLRQSWELVFRLRDAKDVDAALAEFHKNRSPQAVPEAAPKERGEPLREMVGKSMALPPKADKKIVVVVAGGLTKYTAALDQYLADGKRRTPEECKKHVFETVLGEKLEGRSDVFVTGEPTSIAIPDED